jgi:DNA-binding response OmpR family regulator
MTVECSWVTFMTSKAALLAIDKDDAVIIQTALDCAGFTFESFDSALSLVRGLRRDAVRVVIVDVDRTDKDVQQLLEWRGNCLNPDVAIVAVGGADAHSAANALSAGLDDFIAKPLRGAELIARIGTAVRRKHQSAADDVPVLHGCMLDISSSNLVTPRANVALTARELGVLQLLFRYAGKLVTTQMLANEVWGMRSELSGRTIAQHIYQIRRKLQRCACGALTVRSVYGSGYRLESGRQQPQPTAFVAEHGEQAAVNVAPVAPVAHHHVADCHPFC